ncbi:hypothetical protein Bca101_024941 [Brassica carinata]
MKLDTNGFETSIPTIGNNMLDDFSILSSTDIPRTTYVSFIFLMRFFCVDPLSSVGFDMQFTHTCSMLQCFSVDDLYQQSCDYAMSTLDEFSNTSGTEDFQQQNISFLANSSLIHCGRQNGTQKSQCNRFGHFREASLRFFYNANVVFVLARLR